MASTSRLTIVCCAEFGNPEWRWVERPLNDERLRFEFASCVPSNFVERRIKRINLARIRGSFAAARLARRTNADVLVAHSPSLTAWCSLFARVLGAKARVVGHTFNFTELPGKAKLLVFAWALRHLNTFVVFSNLERALYARTFGLPETRFQMVHWGVQVPEVEAQVPLERGEYVCAIGGNARDYQTLLAAARHLPQVPFVLVVRPENLRGLDVPPNVKVHVNLPFARTMNVLAHSRFMVLPLQGSATPCGHVTLVSAMHLGKTFVVTDSAGVADYVHPEVDSLTVPAANSEALASATARLWNDPALCRRLGENGQRFANDACSEARIAEHFRRWLEQAGLLQPKSASAADEAALLVRPLQRHHDHACMRDGP